MPNPENQPVLEDNSIYATFRKLRDLQMQIREPLELQDHPEYKQLARDMVLHVLEQRENELMNKMGAIDESEEAWYKSRADKTVPLPLDNVLYPELPGEAEALRNCLVADPVREENPI
jgi:hypothetical protein